MWFPRVLPTSYISPAPPQCSGFLSLKGQDGGKESSDWLYMSWLLCSCICGGELRSDPESGGDSGNMLRNKKNVCSNGCLEEIKWTLLENQLKYLTEKKKLTKLDLSHCSNTVPEYWCLPQHSPTHHSNLGLKKKEGKKRC